MMSTRDMILHAFLPSEATWVNLATVAAAVPLKDGRFLGVLCADEDLSEAMTLNTDKIIWADTPTEDAKAAITAARARWFAIQRVLAYDPDIAQEAGEIQRVIDAARAAQAPPAPGEPTE